MTIITRAMYMATTHDANHSEIHQKYFAQFVTDGTREFVRRRIGMGKLRASDWLARNNID